MNKDLKLPVPDYAVIPRIKRNLLWFTKAPHIFAVIDIGSKNWKIELLTKDCKRIVFSQHKIRFSEQEQDGYLDDHKIKLLAETLLYWIKELKQLKISPQNTVMVTTESVRRAKNQSALLEHLKLRGVELPLKILTHAQEAYYGVAGTLHHQKYHDPVNIVEIGGGSMQVSLLEDPYFKTDYRGAFKQLEQHIQNHPSYQKLQQSSAVKNKTLVLVGGSFWRIQDLMIQQKFQISEEKALKKVSLQKLFDYVNYGNYEKVSAWHTESFPDIPALLIAIKILEFLVKAVEPKKVLVGDGGLRHGVNLNILEIKNLAD